LDATLRHFKDTISLSAKESLSESIEAQKAIILQGISQRNSGFFENEMGKLEHWADDVKSSLEIELKNLDKEIRFRRTESKRILNLDEKVAAQREIKEMEKKRNVLRQDLFRAQDEVDVKKEDLIGKIEIQLKQQLLMKDLFTVRWQMR
jgi:hypothetical protein